MCYNAIMDETGELHKELAQLRRARKLVAALDQLPNAEWETTLGIAQRMNDEQWDGLALLAGIKPPSLETRKFVIEALEERLRIKRRMMTSPAYLALHGDEEASHR